VGLRELYDRYGHDVQFLSIYVREAHPKDGWWLGGPVTGTIQRLWGSPAATDVDDPKTIEERRAVAGRCEESLDYGIPTLVDEMDDAVNTAYAAWPTRLYLVDIGGVVIYRGGLGPWGFSATELGQSIEEYLAEERQGEEETA
jgi:hypothetical protein